jgi:hypothetical protein
VEVRCTLNVVKMRTWSLLSVETAGDLKPGSVDLCFLRTGAPNVACSGHDLV